VRHPSDGRMGRCRVGGDDSLVMWGQGLEILSARTMFQSLNIISGLLCLIRSALSAPGLRLACLPSVGLL
jgi:hypothetical protein